MSKHMIKLALEGRLYTIGEYADGIMTSIENYQILDKNVTCQIISQVYMLGGGYLTLMKLYDADSIPHYYVVDTGDTKLLDCEDIMVCELDGEEYGSTVGMNPLEWFMEMAKERIRRDHVGGIV